MVPLASEARQVYLNCVRRPFVLWSNDLVDSMDGLIKKPIQLYIDCYVCNTISIIDVCAIHNSLVSVLVFSAV